MAESTATAIPPTSESTGTAVPPTAAPESTATPATPAAERITFAAGTTYATIQGHIGAGETLRYVFGVTGGQLIEVSADTLPVGQDTLAFSIVGANNVIIKIQGQPFFRGTVPTTQDYTLALTNSGAATDFTLSLMIPIRITFAPGTSTIQIPETQAANSSLAFVIRALGGQTLNLNAVATEGQVILIVYGADGTVLQTDHAGSPTFSGHLPTTQDYLIDVRAVGGGPASYTLNVSVPPMGSTTATPTPTPEPGAATRILFAAGATQAQFPGHIDANSTNRYLVGVSAGQLMEVDFFPTTGLTLAIVGANGQVVMPPGPAFFRGVVPTTQDYTLIVTSGSQAVDYTMTVIIPQRITFAPGAVSGQGQASIPPSTTGHFVVHALAGQTMTVETATSQGQVVLIVYGADGSVLLSDHAGATGFTGVLPLTEDYLLDLRSVGSVAANVMVTVTIPAP